MAIDTLKVARRLREAGFSEPQAEAVVEAVRGGTEEAELATKHDLALLSAELRAEVAAVRVELSGAIATLRAEMREMEQRLIAKIEAANGALFNRVVGIILGALLVNVVAIIGSVFAVARLLVH